MSTEPNDNLPEIILEACASEHISACDLSAHIEEARRDGTRIETFRLIELDDAGYSKSIEGQMLWYPDHFRAGIAWGADADWTDADTAEHAVELYRAGTMVN